MRKYFGEGNFSLSLNTGYTVYKSFSPKLIEYFEDDNYFTGIVSAEYRYCPYDLTFGVKAGNFLYNNIAARFDLLRQFGELKIGFFATVTKSSDFNGGFNFSIPLPPGKYMRIKYLRVRQSKDFSLEYRAKGFSKSVGTYDTGSQLYNILMEYNADFFKKRLIKELF
ncbi:MAG: YjbH domain-containing protein [Lentimicrobium sp.]|nr:YjbH domain-containing protein [Lentimicrobium sp.]